MTLAEWLVLAAGTSAIVWVNWYFFVAGKVAAPVAVGAGSRQELDILVDGGYDPQVVRVKAGQPVKLVFDRRDTGGCSEEVVFPDFGIRRFLPTGKKTTVEITPPAAGRYEFTCGMSMLRGSVIAED